MRNFDPTLYLVTNSDDYSEEEFLTRIEAALIGGVTLVQIREKDKSTRAYIDLTKKVHAVTARYNVPLLVDDRVDVALAAGTEGVHLGQTDMPVDTARRILGDDKIIGATTKTLPQVKEAYEKGADYLGVGAMYPTTTKVVTVLTKPETLAEIIREVPLPANAIGGLNANNLDILEGIPVAGVCAVTAIMKANDPEAAAREMKKQVLALKTRAGSRF